MSFDQLKQEYLSCKKCPILCKNRSQVVFGSGNKNAEILLIGEAPGASEDKQGIPFCGMSGKILSELLNTINLQREDIFITNTVMCKPPKNRNPTTEEIENCRDRLDRLIEIIKPKVIVTIGNFATERILGKKGITSLRGKIFERKINNQQMKIIPIIHPANYLYSGRNTELFETMKSDFKTISEQINTVKTQTNLVDF